MNFQVMTPDQFEPIRTKEIRIHQQLRSQYEYQIDSYGDILLDSNFEPVIDRETDPVQINLPEYPEVHGLDARVPEDTLCGFKDVFSLDRTLKAMGMSLLVGFRNGIYQGCTWFYFNDRYFGIYGIRSSISNYLNRVKGVASEILSEVERMAQRRTIIVPNPLSSMIQLLTKRGFVEHQNPNTDEYRFARIVDGAHSYWMLTPNI